MAIRSMRLKCSKHLVWLVLDVQIVNKASGPVRIEYWKCPLDCGYVRSNKYQAKPVRSREPGASIKARGTAKTAAGAKRRTQITAALERNDRQASFSF